MTMCWVRAMKYGVALFPYSMKAGRKRRQKMIIECIGPRCCRPGINRSTSGIMEARNNRGMFTFMFRILDVTFPDKYPKARCPTAYVSCSSDCLSRFNVFCVIYALYLRYIS